MMGHGLSVPKESLKNLSIEKNKFLIMKYLRMAKYSKLVCSDFSYMNVLFDIILTPGSCRPERQWPGAGPSLAEEPDINSSVCG